jgi:hypothetical protein
MLCCRMGTMVTELIRSCTLGGQYNKDRKVGRRDALRGISCSYSAHTISLLGYWYLDKPSIKKNIIHPHFVMTAIKEVTVSICND